MNHKNLLMLIAATATLWLGACGDTAEAEAPKRAKKTAAKPVVRRNLLEDTDTLRRAQTTLPQQAQFQGKPVYVFEKIDFFDGTRPRIELQAQDPLRPNKLLLFRYENGQWQFVDDEDELNSKKPSRHLTLLEHIPFTDVPLVAKMWRQHAAQTRAVVQEPYHIAHVLLPKTQKRFWHTAELEAHGAQYYLSINPDFSIFEFKKL
ncbi:hypothetical protein [Conchiformibius kuhniae]|uniref:Lipoprotein n=1 Tax=Conchiformibius kuhniae TaxID=211502 RepID=A0A8T9MY76_9NEIS|nr:hypothetical protein [Conchiformibius kuhniae]UOP05152.1 hypothetical protein LVJ77_02495 [Conchiformibius kuhniae]